MKRFMQVVVVGAMALGGMVASPITTSGITTNVGTVGTFNISTFSASSTNMAGLSVTVTWSTGGPSSCTWSNVLGGCSGSGFSISEADGSLDSYNGQWRFTNSTTSGAKVTSITLTGNGFVGFDVCWLGLPASGSRSLNNNGTDGTSTGNSGGTCGQEGTPGSNIGWTASGLSGGNTNTAITTTYSNQIRLPSGPTNGVGDEFSQVLLNFGTGSNFGASSTAFTWRMDSDIFLGGVPEPATFGLVGISLLALGALRFRRPNK